MTVELVVESKCDGETIWAVWYKTGDADVDIDIDGTFRINTADFPSSSSLRKRVSPAMSLSQRDRDTWLASGIDGISS
jgi:hypothetical protein